MTKGQLFGGNGRFPEEVTLRLRHDEPVEAAQEVGQGDGEPSGHGDQNHKKPGVGGTETVGGMLCWAAGGREESEAGEEGEDGGEHLSFPLLELEQEAHPPLTCEEREAPG